jgi:DNA primase
VPFSQETIDEVRARNDIVDVIGEYVQLKKAGSSYMGLCPFHSEKTPSFSVSPSKQIFHCFGCGKGGNVITFVMEEEHLSFPEAVRFLAERAGMQIEETGYTPGQQEAARKKREREEALFAVNKDAAYFYVGQLHKKEGERGLAYLHGRQLTDGTIRAWGLGFAPASGHALYDYLKGKGYKDDILSKAGLFSYKGEHPYDLFWNRVMFPIMDERRRVIGFGGRVMGDGKPKYLNSPETEIFDKRNHLFGIHKAARSRAGNFIICEGYMDVISMQQAGFTQAVASLGTALTEAQVKIIARYTDQVRITYDSDSAGTKASLRAIGLFDSVTVTDRATRRKKHIQTRVIRMDPYKDPDEFIKALGADEFQKRIDGAQDSFLFRISALEKQYDRGTPRGDTDFAEAAAREIAGLPSAFERREYLHSVAEQFRLREDDLRELVEQAVPEVREEQEAQQLAGQRRRQYEQTDRRAQFQERREHSGTPPSTANVSARSPQKKVPAGLIKAENFLLTILAEEPRYFRRIREYIGPDDFEESHRQLAQEAFRQLEEKGAVDVAALTSRYQTSEEIQTAANAFSAAEMRARAEQRAQALNDCVRTIREASLKAKLQEAAKRLKSGDASAAVEYREAAKQLQEVPRIQIIAKKN